MNLKENKAIFRTTIDRPLNTKISIVLALISFFALSVQGQQNPQWTQYALNQYLINPAYGGLDRSLSITASIRSQWSQFPGAPKTQALNGHLPLYFLNGSAGFTLQNDQLGPFKRASFTLGYNYVVSSSFGLFSTGFRLGVQQINIDSESLITPTGSYIDGIVDHNDPRLENADLSGYSPIWSGGVFFMKDLLQIGLTVDNIGNSFEVGNSTFNEHLLFSLYGSYQYPITEVLSVEPNLFVKTDGTQTQVDLGLLGYYGQFIAGISVRGLNSNSLDAMGVLAGIRVSDNVRVSYSFDIGLSTFTEFHDGTHEFFIQL